MDQVIDNVISLVHDQKGNDFINISAKQDPNILLDILGREQLNLLDKKWPNPQKRLKMVDFVKLMLSVIEHTQQEMLFLIMGLVELYRDILISSANQEDILKSDITSYVSDRCNLDPFDQRLKEKRIPVPRKFELNLDRIREIDIDAPEVIDNQPTTVRILAHSIITDCVRHKSGGVQAVQFSSEMNRIITLDALGTKLNIYDLNCQVQQYVSVKSPNQTIRNDDEDVIIMGFAWSERQQRIGVTVKSQYLCFFDKADGFKESRIIPTSVHCQRFQSNMWFLENFNIWLSTDASNRIFMWDLQEQYPSQIFQSHKIKDSVVLVVEVVHLKLMATGTLDKHITFWDLGSSHIKFQINMEIYGGVHGMLFSYDYQILITCGYSTDISLFEIHPHFFDHTLIGKLSGHSAMLSSITMMGTTPVLCSSDVLGTIRLWNIKTFQCVQNVSLGRKTIISKIIDLSEKGFICFLNNRVNLIKLDGKSPKKNVDESLIKVEFDPRSEELILVTQKELHFVDIHSGRVRKIYRHLVSGDEEIIQLRTANNFTRFYVADSKGFLKMYNMSDGSLLKVLNRQASDIQHIRVDGMHNLVLMAGIDSIQVQKEDNKGSQTLKSVTNILNIQHLEISVHHNLILLIAEEKMLFYDYEYLRLLGVFKSPEVSLLLFLGMYNILLIGGRNLRFFSFTIKEQTDILLTEIGVLNLSDIDTLMTGQNVFTTSTNIQLQSFQTLLKAQFYEEQNCEELYLATDFGRLYVFDMMTHLKNIPKIEPHYSKTNYNAHRLIKESFPEQFKITPQKQYEIAHKLRLKTQNLILTLQAQSKIITVLQVLQLDEKFIITANNEGLLKIHTKQGQMVACLNVNHPLPIKWVLSYSKREQTRLKVVFALKIIETLAQTTENKKNFSIGNLAHRLNLSPGEDPKKSQRFGKATSQSILPSLDKRKKPILLAEEFTPRDLKYDSLRSIYQNEIQGPSLKQMETLQRLNEATGAWKAEQQLIEKQRVQDIKLQKADGKEGKATLDFLDVNYHQKVLTGQILIPNDPKVNDGSLADILGELLHPKLNTQNSEFVQKKTQIKSFESRMQSPDFFEYASNKHLFTQSNSNTTRESLHTPRSDYKLSYLAKHPEKLEEASIMRPHELSQQKSLKLKNVLTNMNLQLIKSKRNQPFLNPVTQRPKLQSIHL